MKIENSGLDLKNRLKIRLLICYFLIWATGVSVVCCFGLIFLQGFRFHGFHMNELFLKWIFGSTITEVVVLLGVFVRAAWEK
jgi:hypothetical protein